MIVRGTRGPAPGMFTAVAGAAIDAPAKGLRARPGLSPPKVGVRCRSPSRDRDEHLSVAPGQRYGRAQRFGVLRELRTPARGAGWRSTLLTAPALDAKSDR